MITKILEVVTKEAMMADDYAEDLTGYALAQAGGRTGRMDIEGPQGAIYNKIFRTSKDAAKRGRGRPGGVTGTVAMSGGTEDIDPETGLPQTYHKGLPYSYQFPLGKGQEVRDTIKAKREQIEEKAEKEREEENTKSKIEEAAAKKYQEKYGMEVPSDAAEMERRKREVFIVAEIEVIGYESGKYSR